MTLPWRHRKKMKALVGNSYPLYSKYKDITYMDVVYLDNRLSYLDNIGAISLEEYHIIRRALENTYPIYKTYKKRKVRYLE